MSIHSLSSTHRVCSTARTISCVRSASWLLRAFSRMRSRKSQSSTFRCNCRSSRGPCPCMQMLTTAPRRLRPGATAGALALPLFHERRARCLRSRLSGRGVGRAARCDGELGGGSVRGRPAGGKLQAAQRRGRADTWHWSGVLRGHACAAHSAQAQTNTPRCGSIPLPSARLACGPGCFPFECVARGRPELARICPGDPRSGSQCGCRRGRRSRQGGGT